MSTGMDLRKRVKRQDPRSTRKAHSSPLDAIDAGSPGEIRIPNQTLYALLHLYQNSPSIQAARTILLGQLLSSGVVVRRSGQDVKLKETFQNHLSDVWIPFARDVIDNFLMFGFCVVSLEEEPQKAFANFKRGRKQAAEGALSHMAPPPGPDNRATKTPTSSADVRARKRSIVNEDARPTKLETMPPSAVNLIPIVPDLGQWELSFWHTGTFGYVRQYRLFATNSDNVYRQDTLSEVFFKTPPDSAGNVCSPVATCFQSASFISALEELALQAEVVRSRQLLVTQPMVKHAQNQNLDPANLFFDSEARAVQASATAEDDAQQAGSLAMQARLMQILNRMQTTNAPEGGVPAPKPPSHIPPALPPSLFACPERQSVVPGVRPPEARSDLVDLMRVVNDHVAAALGVPASVIFEGKFSSNSMSQCANHAL